MFFWFPRWQTERWSYTAMPHTYCRSDNGWPTSGALVLSQNVSTLWGWNKSSCVICEEVHSVVRSVGFWFVKTTWNRREQIIFHYGDRELQDRSNWISVCPRAGPPADPCVSNHNYNATISLRLDNSVFSPGVCPGLMSVCWWNITRRENLLHEQPAQKESDPMYEQRTELHQNIQKPTFWLLCVTLTQPSLFKHGCSSAPSAILLSQQEANTIKIKAVHLWEGFRKLHTSSDSEDSAENWSWHTWTHVQPQGLKNQEWGSEKKSIEGLFPASWLTMKITKTGQIILIFTLNSSVSDAEYFTPAAEVGLFS